MANKKEVKKIRLGDLLVGEGLISDQQLGDALASQKTSGKKLGRALIDLGFIEEDAMLGLLSQQLDVPFIQLRNYDFNFELTARLPETYARRFRAVVLKEQNGHILIGMADPTDIFGFDELSRIIQQPLDLAVVRESELLDSLDILYRRTQEISSLAEELEDELGDDDGDVDYLEATGAEDAPVVKLLRSIFEDAVQVKASDIHIEPDETVLRIRQRVDGVLQEHVMNEKRIAPALVLRLKLMSGLNISEKRLPQDGRFNIAVKGRSIDVRISTLPAQFGESVVMRLLDQGDGAIDLNHVGMPQNLLTKFRHQVTRPHGLILVTGPTGSGKTTTLYGALQELNKAEKKIITVEDPVEYTLPRITQVQVNEKIGLGFGQVLRSTLRQDPDILLVGEIRDQETAEIAVRASLTGHLVLSTLHTNDAITSAMRLIDVGLEGYLVASSLRAVVAQRLVRRICESCRQPYQPTAQEKQWLNALADNIDNVNFSSGRGCSHCNHTGYRGRIGIFELLEIDNEMADALRVSDPIAFAAAARKQPGFKPLTVCALEYATQGITSIEEVLRVSEQIAEEGEAKVIEQVQQQPEAEA
ncbi:GspE/PulE family protein [Dasania sp. GY-MA-18]|uniref:GspE/PulE family protein n=1 Tax=Dasania phycosphaerae TaxID=2950436 RepID=A0A9J6RMD5_9GAMM|nr:MULTISPECIES: GspE/PulE family protein [Dasania]MCR8923050.1 GspE/PulE family protein [Dasania sp. GY-MA-18]MCZ0865481.1 GspE/PulE family protein [Dasania phycosphaerae]MCZ0869206.1 GspE/PulE family protein [Dasania phycosphaerae]